MPNNQINYKISFDKLWIMLSLTEALEKFQIIIKYYKYLFICLFVYLFICLLSISTVFAQTTTPDSSDNQNGATNAIKGIRDVVKEKVQEQLNVLKTGAKRAYVGQLTQISDTSLSVETSEGTIQVKVDSNTDYVNKNRAAIKISNLKNNDYVIAMGLLETDNSITGKRIVVIDKPVPYEKEIAVGKISDISKDGTTITLKNDNKAKTYSLSVNKNAKTTQKINEKIDKMNLADLQKGDIVFAVGIPDKTNNKILDVSLIHLLAKSLGVPTQNASTTTPTPSVKVKVTPTP